MATDTSSGAAMAARLKAAVDAHDLEALTACFDQDFVNETPLHPARSFRGRDQVTKNWAQIFAAVPDIRADLLRCTEDGARVWCEWEMRGTRAGGQEHLMRGVSVFETGGGRFQGVRFYLEPVESGGPGIDEAVRRTVGR